jgi:bifunctional non-homologous end joining protein LigD
MLEQRHRLVTEEVVQAVRGLGLEGLIAKRRNSLYEPGERSGDWLKLKLELQQEFVIGWYRPGSNGIDLWRMGGGVGDSG